MANGHLFEEKYCTDHPVYVINNASGIAQLLPRAIVTLLPTCKYWWSRMRAGRVILREYIRGH